ncbi:MAG: winged helix-turn-helix domain-containing protein [Bifidobacterium sp.]|nr:winged helix-turn-helix domain-containing protein [Bifidobacterium sp.]
MSSALRHTISLIPQKHNSRCTITVVNSDNANTANGNAESDEITEISQDAVLLAISNQSRMRILGLLRMDGPLSVGRVSEQTGMAPGSVSFHLRKLAEAGMAAKITPEHADARTSWWKATYRAMRPAPSEDNRLTGAQYAYRRAVAVTYESLYERYLDALNDLPDQWRAVGMCEDRSMELTPQEMDQMCHELDELVHRWQLRAQTAREQDKRNTQTADEVKRVQVVMQAFPWIP